MVLLLVGLASCVPPAEAGYTHAYVYSSESGEFVPSVCTLDDEGYMTSDCDSRDEPVMDASIPPSTMPIKAPKVTPPPSADDVMRAVTRKDVARLVAQCHAAYAADLASVRFTLSIAPSGQVTHVSLADVGPPFADCAARALWSATFSPFDGPAVTYEQQLEL